MEVINQQVTELMVLVFSGVITILGLYAVLFVSKLRVKLQAEINAIGDESTRKLVDNALTDLTNVVNKNIIYCNETLVKELRLASEDGVVSRDELKAIAGIVKQRSLEQIGSDTYNVVNKNLDDIDGYIESIIEVELVKVKNEIEKLEK